ncbi:Arp-1 [Aphelenchoides fujianensis]|nr:Arp-1 [Aphelenchoides fujianensis]
MKLVLLRKDERHDVNVKGGQTMQDLYDAATQALGLDSNADLQFYLGGDRIGGERTDKLNELGVKTVNPTPFDLSNAHEVLKEQLGLNGFVITSEGPADAKNALFYCQKDRLLGEVLIHSSTCINQAGQATSVHFNALYVYSPRQTQLHSLLLTAESKHTDVSNFVRHIDGSAQTAAEGLHADMRVPKKSKRSPSRIDRWRHYVSNWATIFFTVFAMFLGQLLVVCKVPEVTRRPSRWPPSSGRSDFSRSDSYVGNEAQKYRGILSPLSPMKHWIVTNWTDMRPIWEHAYSPEQLNCKSSEHSVPLSEAPLNPTSNREKATEIFFETFNVPAIHVQLQAVLSLYAAGRTTGVALDAGDGVSHAFPSTRDSPSSRRSIQRIDVAGRDVTNCLNILLRKEGHIFHRTSELEIVRDIKEKVCFVSSSVHSAKDDKELKSYVMPDGSTIKIGAAHHQTPEALFRPDLIGCEYAGVSQCIVNAIRESAFELRKELCANVLLSGGTTMFPGFGERVLQDMKKAFQPQDLKIKIYAPADLLSCTRTGGSILATLATFRKIVITKAQYENEGNGLARKAY